MVRKIIKTDWSRTRYCDSDASQPAGTGHCDGGTADLCPIDASLKRNREDCLTNESDPVGPATEDPPRGDLSSGCGPRWKANPLWPSKVIRHIRVRDRVRESSLRPLPEDVFWILATWHDFGGFRQALGEQIENASRFPDTAPALSLGEAIPTMRAGNPG